MTTKENNDMIAWPELEWRCDTRERVQGKFFRVRCNKPAVHIVTAKHDIQGCKATTHAVCAEHQEPLIDALNQRLITLAGSLALGIPAHCAYCNTELTELDDAGTLTCLY